MSERILSAGRTDQKADGFDPSKVLWTLMFFESGQAKPLYPEYVGITHEKARGLLLELRPKFPTYRLYMTETKADHITLARARTVLKDMFTAAGKPELAQVARKARPVDMCLLGNVALSAVHDKERREALEKTNEQRAAKGLRPIPGIATDRRTPRAEPEITTENGRVVIHLGGAR